MSEYINTTPSPVKISTMTITAFTNIRCVDIVKTAELCDSDEHFPDDSFIITKRKSGFRNCIIFKVQFDSKTKIKKRTVAMNIFSTGTINLTGVLCLGEAETIVTYIFGKLKERSLLCIEDGVDLTIDFNIRMINSFFNIGCFNIDLLGLFDTFAAKNSENELVLKFNPSTHPGLQVKVKVEESYTTCILFGSGKALITGAKSVSSIDVVYRFINRFIDSNFSNCQVKPPVVISSPKKRGRKRKIID